MREQRELFEFANAHRGEHLVLAEVVATEGSTYKKTGARKLIASTGESAGLLSGGCLEGEIIATALTVSDQPLKQSYSTKEETDRLLGYGLGCTGVIDVEFQKVQIDDAWLENEQSLSRHQTLKLVIVGAGLDIDPLVEIVNSLGWDLQVFDHRSDFVEQRRQQKWPVQVYSDELFHEAFRTHERNAVLLMSHNYTLDLEAFSICQGLSLDYVGILGPSARKQQLLTDLKAIKSLEWPEENLPAVHGPIGISGLGKGEAAIAVSVVAELQKIFYGE